MEDAVQGAAEAAPAHVTSVGVADDLFGDIAKLIPLEGGVNGMTVTLIAVAVFGGIALKIVPSFLKSRTELRLKELELEEKKVEQGQEAHAECKVERASMDVRLSALEVQVEKLGKASKKPARR